MTGSYGVRLTPGGPCGDSDSAQNTLADGNLDSKSPMSETMKRFGALNREPGTVGEFNDRSARILNDCCEEKANCDFTINVVEGVDAFKSLLGRGLSGKGPDGKGGSFSILSPANPRNPTRTRGAAKRVLSFYLDGDAQTVEAAASKAIPRNSLIYTLLEKCRALTQQEPRESFMKEYSRFLNLAKGDESCRDWICITELDKNRRNERTTPPGFTY